MTKQQLQLLTPEAQDLQGFMQVRPAGELPEGWASPVWSPQTRTLTEPISPAVPTEDRITLDNVARLGRTFYSVDGVYRMYLEVTLCATPAAAAKELADYRHSCQSIFVPGAFDGKPAIGDESWVMPNVMVATDSVLITRVGRVMVLVAGGPSAATARHQSGAEFPKAAVEAAAYQVLLRASQQAKLTGVPAQATRLAVNGHALPKNALLVGKQTYIPVREFAKAMDLTSGWDARTGTLTLSRTGYKPVALTAGSTAATVGGAKASALTVPVLKDGGEPVMVLDDLLRLTGGRITGHAGDTVQVKG